MTAGYNLKLAMMEKRLNDKMNPLTVDEIRYDLNLRFETLNQKTNDNENGNNQEVAFFGGQFKRKCRNCDEIGHKARECKDKFSQNGGTAEIKIIFKEIQMKGLTALIVVGQGITKETASS
jgi:Zinc knuckle